MTDRIKGFTITLEEDIRIDDIEYIKNAISMIKGISSVDETLTNVDDHMNRQMVKGKIRDKFLEFYKENLL